MSSSGLEWCVTSAFTGEVTRVEGIAVSTSALATVVVRFNDGSVYGYSQMEATVLRKVRDKVNFHKVGFLEKERDGATTLNGVVAELKRNHLGPVRKLADAYQFPADQSTQDYV